MAPVTVARVAQGKLPFLGFCPSVVLQFALQLLFVLFLRFRRKIFACTQNRTIFCSALAAPNNGEILNKMAMALKRIGI